MSFGPTYSRENNDDGWENHGGYLAAKHRKLDKQYSESINHVSDIFKNCVIYVNGYTSTVILKNISDPSSEEIKKVVIENGGSFAQVPSKRVTHVIANTLPSMKQKRLKNEKVLNPSWIFDSVKNGKLMKWQDYLSYKNKFANTRGQSFIKPLQDKKVLPEVNEQEKLVKTFYERSRLHHISTWASECKEFVKSLPDAEGWCSPLGSELLSYLNDNFSTAELLTKYYVKPHSSSSVTKPTFVLHIDLDCFFVSVSIRYEPDLRDKPVAIAHSRGKNNGDFSMSEIASCSYAARDKGIKNGMLIGKAKQLCPNLHILPYDFEGYKKISNKFYESLSELTNHIEAVSCDEVYLDATDILLSNPLVSNTNLSKNDLICLNPTLFAKSLRKLVSSRLSGCPCSIGIGTNKLLARMATKYAKPNGEKLFFGHLINGNLNTEARWCIEGEQSQVTDSELSGESLDWFDQQLLSSLPGIGHATVQKLNSMTLGDTQICKEVRETLEKSALINLLGKKTGEKLYFSVRGIDFDKVKLDHLAKSVSVELNYGIRFKNWEDALSMVKALTGELLIRAGKLTLSSNENSQSKGVFGEALTVKLMTRSAGQPVEPKKFLGHGICDKSSKTVKITNSYNDTDKLSKQIMNTIKVLTREPTDIRGVGIQLSKLKPMLRKRSSLLDSFARMPKLPSIDEDNNSCEDLFNESTQGSHNTSNLSQLTTSSQDLFASQERLPSLSELPCSTPKRGTSQGSSDIFQSSSFALDSTIEPIVISDEEPCDDLQLTRGPPIDDLFRDCAADIVYKLIDEWVSEEPVPNQTDIAYLAQHLVCLVPTNLALANKYFRRFKWRVDQMESRLARMPSTSSDDPIPIWRAVVNHFKEVLNECVSLHFYGACLYKDNF